ncbi:hypothetical protein D3C81_1556960 [compost metagenome]
MRVTLIGKVNSTFNLYLSGYILTNSSELHNDKKREKTSALFNELRGNLIYSLMRRGGKNPPFYSRNDLSALMKAMNLFASSGVNSLPSIVKANLSKI